MTTLKYNWTIQEIAKLVGGELVGTTEGLVSGVASVEEAGIGDLVFAESERYVTAALDSRATAVLTNRAALPENPPSEKSLIMVENPRQAFVQVLEMFAPSLTAVPGVHATAILGENVTLGQDVHVGANAILGDNVTLGDRVIVLPGVFIGEGSSVGDDTVLHPNVVLYPRVSVGKRCILHAAVVIGADGFGYIAVGRALRKVPQLGTVEIHDDVEIGANACIDRAKTGATVIGAGTKIDNLVHVGHNVKVGQSTLLIAQVGLGGGAEIGNGVILAGQAGVVDHVTIGDGAKVGAQAGVIGNVAAGATYSGFPARPHAEKMREYAALAQMPGYVKRIRALEKRLEALEGRVSE